MEFASFFKLLAKHKYTLIIIPLVAIVITYILVRNQPDVYSSQAQIATGLVDQTQQTLSDNNVQESQINQQFSNLIEMLRSKKMLDQVSYKLIIHDLSGSTPYHKPSKLFNQLSGNAKKHALAVFADLYNKKQPLSLFSRDQNGLHKLLESMKYDDQSLLQTLIVYRAQNSDFIDVQFDANNAQMSAFVVNTLCSEFISYYTQLLKENQHKAVTFLANLLQAKQDTLNRRMENLKNYKIKNQVLNLSEEARALYSQITDFETRLDQAKKDEVAYAGAIRSIDNQFNPTDRRYAESSLVHINQDIVNTRSQLAAANERYVQGGFNQRDKKSVDSLKEAISNQIAQSSDKYILNPLNNKQNLVQQKMTLQIQYDLAKNSQAVLAGQIVRLNQRLNTLVPHEAVVQSYESAIAVAGQEYIEILKKYNQTSLETSLSVRLKQTEMAMPGLPQPSKKMLLVILSGIITFVFCVAVLFILFLLDATVKTPAELANRTKVPVLGYLNLLNSQTMDMRSVWGEVGANAEMRTFRNLVQSIRFEVDNELHGNKTILINSLSKGEGKTFVTMNMAYAYSSINKKVLIIDGNFVHPGITEIVKPKFYLEDYLAGKIDEAQLNPEPKITVLGNRGNDISVLEIADQMSIAEKLAKLSERFDIILIEASALETLNKSKEWTLFVEKILTVFQAGQAIKDSKKTHTDYLKNFNGRFIGWILNTVDKEQVPEVAEA
jgi:capsular polysaccharide biosynthesis protein/Mrp family chromosome partitioning ATPase